MKVPCHHGHDPHECDKCALPCPMCDAPWGGLNCIREPAETFADGSCGFCGAAPPENSDVLLNGVYAPKPDPDDGSAYLAANGFD